MACRSRQRADAARKELLKLLEGDLRLFQSSGCSRRRTSRARTNGCLREPRHRDGGGAM